MTEIEKNIGGLERMRITFVTSTIDGDRMLPFLTAGVEALKRINKNPDQIIDLGDTLYCVDEDMRCYNTKVTGIILMQNGEYEYQTPDGEFYREDVGESIYLDVECRKHYYGE